MSPELNAQQIAKLKNLSDDELLIACNGGYRDPNVDPFDAVVRAIIEWRQLRKIATVIGDLNAITRESRQEIRRLADSSETMEGLTRTLKNLTVWLIVLTIAAVVVPIGVEAWRAYLRK